MIMLFLLFWKVNRKCFWEIFFKMEIPRFARNDLYLWVFWGNLRRLRRRKFPHLN